MFGVQTSHHTSFCSKVFFPEFNMPGLLSPETIFQFISTEYSQHECLFNDGVVVIGLLEQIFLFFMLFL